MTQLEEECVNTYEWMIREVYDWAMGRRQNPPSLEDFAKKLAEESKVSDYVERR